MQTFLPAGTTYPEFASTKYVQGTKKVLPTISDDLKSGAYRATIFALIIIFFYIFIRFRDWRYSLGTIIALFHDIFVTLAVFSFLHELVPFPLELNQHFIAALLTVIGFSMNDTVIVFDRIRENSHLMKGATNAQIINKSVNDTLSRTIMTSLTVFLTLLILFLVGGEVTRGFAFAMLIGVITGTYSSIFVAAPFLVDFAKTRPLGGEAPQTSIKVTEKPKASYRFKEIKREFPCSFIRKKPVVITTGFSLFAINTISLTMMHWFVMVMMVVMSAMMHWAMGLCHCETGHSQQENNR